MTGQLNFVEVHNLEIIYIYCLKKIEEIQKIDFDNE